jgi:glycerol-3-phosphate cytidylyltransferase-like family protein
VGLHSDEDITERRGPHLPLMDVHERSLSVLACKYVDEVIIGAWVPVSVCLACKRGLQTRTGDRSEGP